MHIRIYSDGGARGNPGPSGIGVVLINGATSEILEEHAVYLGEGTNNQAEYKAAILGFERAIALGATSVELLADSELLIKQMQGVYKVKHPDIGKRYLELKNLETRLGGRAEYTHIRREQNKRADALANEAMDRRR